MKKFLTKVSDGVEWFLYSTDTWAKILRTLFEVIASAILTYVPDWIYEYTVIPYELKSVIITVMTGIITGILSAMGKSVSSHNAMRRAAAAKAEEEEKENSTAT